MDKINRISIKLLSFLFVLVYDKAIRYSRILPGREVRIILGGIEVKIWGSRYSIPFFPIYLCAYSIP